MDQSNNGANRFAYILLLTTRVNIIPEILKGAMLLVAIS